LSIYAPAKLLGRNYSNVHADVKRLIELGLAGRDATGRVRVPFDDVAVQVDASLVAAA
jgi:predicted transcriptional regulator